MNKACIIRPHYAGLFSLFNCVIECLSRFDSVHVDWRNSMYGPKEENLWEALFKQINPPSPDAVVIDNYPDQRFTYKNAGHLYQLHKADFGWRREYRQLMNRVRVRQQVAEEAVRALWGIRPAGQSHVSCLIRAHTHAGEQITERSQALEEYAAAIEQEIQPSERLFVMTQDVETLAWMMQRFPDRVSFHAETKRSHSRDVDRHLHESQTTQDAVNCLVEALILSRSRALVHCCSNISTFALGCNPEVKSIYLP